MGRNRRTAFHLPEPLRLSFEISGRGISTGASRLSPETFRCKMPATSPVHDFTELAIKPNFQMQSAFLLDLSGNRKQPGLLPDNDGSLSGLPRQIGRGLSIAFATGAVSIGPFEVSCWRLRQTR
jgi:hypothetical protein